MSTENGARTTRRQSALNPSSSRWKWWTWQGVRSPWPRAFHFFAAQTTSFLHFPQWRMPQPSQVPMWHWFVTGMMTVSLSPVAAALASLGLRHNGYSVICWTEPKLSLTRQADSDAVETDLFLVSESLPHLWQRLQELRVGGR